MNRPVAASHFSQFIETRWIAGLLNMISHVKCVQAEHGRREGLQPRRSGNSAIAFLASCVDLLLHSSVQDYVLSVWSNAGTTASTWDDGVLLSELWQEDCERRCFLSLLWRKAHLTRTSRWPISLSGEGELWASVDMSGMSLYGRIIGRRLLVKFERGNCFLVDPGKISST